MRDPARLPPLGSDLVRIAESFAAAPVTGLLGARILSWDSERRVLITAYDARPEFCNLVGTIQGGILTAMLDDAMSYAALVRLGEACRVPSLEIKTTHLAPARQGRVRRGRRGPARALDRLPRRPVVRRQGQADRHRDRADPRMIGPAAPGGRSFAQGLSVRAVSASRAPMGGRASLRPSALCIAGAPNSAARMRVGR